MRKREIKKNKSKQYYFFKSLSYLKPYKGWAFMCLLSCLLVAVLSVFNPIFTEKVLTAFTNSDGKALLISASILLGLQLLQSFIHMIFWGTSADKLRARITKDIRYQATGSVLKLKTKNFDMYGSGNILQVVTGDTASLSGIYMNIIDVLMSTLSKVAIYVYIFFANYILGFYCILEFVVICFVYHMRIKTRMKDQTKLKNQSDKNMGFVNESIRGAREIKNYNIFDNMMEKADTSLKSLEKADAKFGQKQYQLFRVTCITKNIMTFLYIPLALLLIHFNLTTFAVAFTIFVFRTNVVSVIDWIMNTWEYVKDGGLYAERIFKVIDGYKEGFEEFPEKDQFKKLPKKLNVEIKDLTFSFNNENIVLKHLNLRIENNQKVAVVGESGSGKSTIIKLLNRTYDVERDKIFIGGYDICDFSQETLRNTITIVPQDPYIFNFSVIDNLRIINPNATRKQIETACKKAQIHNFITSLPNGYETYLGEGGSLLSGGQRQRLAIARAFLKDSSILIFDESTSALDNENQNEIKKAITNIGKNKIVIIIAHRLSTILDCNKIHLLKDGKIIASGTHEDLLSSSKEYMALYSYDILR